MTLTPPWLTARPIAHRGFHDAASGSIENSISAAQRAIARGFAIECDVQLSADGEAMVFHDDTLERLCGLSGHVHDLSCDTLATLPLRGGPDRVPGFPALCSVVAGRVPIVCEIKSRFDGNMQLCERVAAIAASYEGPMCLESFDPAVMAHLRANVTRLGLASVPLGIVAQADYSGTDEAWSHLSRDRRHGLAHFLHYADTRPDFLSYRVQDLPHAVPFLWRAAMKLPVTVWTVRTPEDVACARQWADQIVFEGLAAPPC